MIPGIRNRITVSAHARPWTDPAITLVPAAGEHPLPARRRQPRDHPEPSASTARAQSVRKPQSTTCRPGPAARTPQTPYRLQATHWED